MERYTVHHFNHDFPDDDACLEFLVREVWPSGIYCRTCEEIRKHHKLTGQGVYSCDHCGTRTDPLAGTIFEKSGTSLKSLFYALYLIWRLNVTEGCCFGDEGRGLSDR